MNAACERCAIAQQLCVGAAADGCGGVSGQPGSVRHARAGEAAEGGGGVLPEAGAARPLHPPAGARSAIPGMGGRDLVRLLAPVSGDDEPGDSDSGGASLDERFARAALSTAVEAGDLEAGRMVHALGAVGVLRAIVDGATASDVLARLRSGDEWDDAAPHAMDAPPGQHIWAAGDRRPPQRAESSTFDEGGSGRQESGAADAEERRIGHALARWRTRLSLTEAERALERAARVGARLLVPDSAWWPEGFASLDDGPPLALWIRGDARRLARLERSLALVGARASTNYGEHVALESAAALSDRGFVIVSGGAYGIDAAAHRATLASGGVTIAFLAGGPDRLYPAGNNELLRRIAVDGVLVAELPPGSAPTRWRFLMRNRLIAAAASATVVVEAGHRSGSLNTAGHAAQMGRPLGAVPGSILSPARRAAIG